MKNWQEKGTHAFSNQSLPLPPRLVGDFLDRRQEILEDAPRAEVDLGVDAHAEDWGQSKRGQPKLSSFALPVQSGLGQRIPIMRLPSMLDAHGLSREAYRARRCGPRDYSRTAQGFNCPRISPPLLAALWTLT